MNAITADVPGHRLPVPHDDAAQRDAALLDGLVAETTLSGIARRVLVVGLSTLPAELRQPHHRRLAREALQPLADAERARLFDLPSDDIVVTWRGPADAALGASLAAIRHLVNDDRRAESPGLFALFNLPSDADRLRQLIAETLDHRRGVAAARRRGARLDGATLAGLEAALAHADIARFARRRAVCEFTAGGFALRWEQRALSIDELGETLAPNHDLQADPWLFRRLTRSLDRRMLSLLAAPDELRAARPFSLALNVATILSPDFLRFDAMLPAGLRGHIVLDLLPADILADPGAFLFARDFVRARHYRLMLRHVAPSLIAVFPPAAHGLDLMELRWSPALTAIGPIETPARVVLHGADSVRALEWGISRGITLFEGEMAAPSARWPSVLGRS